ncbi:hypothetical protein JOF41_002854 [Saccharothrix coeruleofusca]|nr:hypothetical protein [Saccharothrix coeruleofusca]
MDGSDLLGEVAAYRSQDRDAEAEDVQVRLDGLAR